MSKIDINNPDEIQKELEKLVKNKFGQNIQVITQAFDAFKDKPKKETKTTSGGEPDEPKDSISKLQQILNFNKLPKEIKEHLDEYIISQDEAKKTLAIAICDHYNQVRHYNSLSEEDKKDHTYSKQNVLLLGPTGVGKTYMVKQLAKLIGVPFVKADATKYSETGYMGANVEDLIKDLVQQADGDISEAEFGIVYIDEADKLATQGSKHHGKDVNGRGVQLGLLKMMEDTEIDLRAGNDPSSHMQAFMEMQSSGGKLPDKIISTRNILFILSGAFTGLDEIIGKRLTQQAIGFGSGENKKKTNTDKLLKKVSTEDLTNYGLEPEFVGRLPVRVACNSLSIDNLYHILKDSKGSVLSQYKRAFGAYGINIEFEDDALEEIARQASLENTGARSLMTIIEKTLREYKYHLPSTSIQKFKVTKNLVVNPVDNLATLMKKADQDRAEHEKAIHDFAEQFSEKHSMKIIFSQESVEEIIKKLKYSNRNVHSFLESTLSGYEHGLKLILKNIGEFTITIPPESITDPEKTLENWVKASYRRAGASVETQPEDAFT